MYRLAMLNLLRLINVGDDLHMNEFTVCVFLFKTISFFLRIC